MGSQADPAQAVDGLVRAMRDLTTDPNYKLVADVFSEFLFLKDRNDRLTTSHREVLDQYHGYRRDLDETKNKLEKEKRDLEVTIQEKIQEIVQLGAIRSRLEADLEDTNNTLDKTTRDATEAAEIAAQALADLQASKEQELADLQALRETEYSDLKETKEKELADLQALKEHELADLQTLRETEYADLQATKDQELADLQAAKEAVEQEKKEGEEAAAAAAAQAADEIATLTEAKTSLEEWKAQAEIDAEKAAQDIAGLESDKASLEETKAANEAEIAALKETIATLESAKKAVEGALEAANAEIEALKSTIEIKNAEIESLQESMRAAEEQIGSLQQTVEDRNTAIEGLHCKLASETERAEAAISHGESLQSKLTTTEATLELTSQKLADLEQYRTPLHDESNDEIYVNVLDKIWTTIVTLVEETFRPDIDPDILNDPSCWTNLRNSQYLKHATQLAIPLPQSNSNAAKGMRISAVLAVLSRALHKHVFRPVYAFEDEDENLVKFLRVLEDEDPTREAHMRSTLLNMMPERQMELGARRVKTVVREISWLVQHLLGALQFEGFCSGLEAACKLACEQWMRIQMAHIKIEPYFGPPYDDFDWQVLELPEFEMDPDYAINMGLGRSSRNGGGPLSSYGDDDNATLRAHQQDLDGGASVTGAPNAGEGGGNGSDGPLETVEAGNVALPESRAGSSAAGDGASFHDAVSSHTGMMEGDDMEVEPDIDPDEILLVVWPSMCSVEGGDLMSITQGLVISKEQARPALEEVRSRSRLAARPGSRRARTMSMPGQSRGSSPTRGKRESFMAAAQAAAAAASSASPDPANGSAVVDGEEGV